MVLSSAYVSRFGAWGLSAQVVTGNEQVGRHIGIFDGRMIHVAGDLLLAIEQTTRVAKTRGNIVTDFLGSLISRSDPYPAAACAICFRYLHFDMPMFLGLGQFWWFLCAVFESDLAGSPQQKLKRPFAVIFPTHYPCCLQDVGTRSVFPAIVRHCSTLPRRNLPLYRTDHQEGRCRQRDISRNPAEQERPHRNKADHRI